MQHTQVLVVGGSLVGLSAALFLADHGIRAITIERHAGSSPHPRAIGYTTRTMELFRAVGLGGKIEEVPPDFRLRRAQVTSLAGEIIEESPWTPDGPKKAPTAKASPAGMAAIAQDRLEPILRDRAHDLGADIRRSTELLSFRQDANGVTARVRNRVTSGEYQIRADYMIAADGGVSPIRDALNITRSGRGHMRIVRSVLFRADLDEYLKSGVRQWEIKQPDLKAFLTTYMDGRWVLMFTDDIERDKPALDAAIRQAVGRNDIAIEIITTGRWDLSALVADRFSSGRVYLAGDAAHQFPPTRGGYGANTGIHDVHNLVWKLKAVLEGAATPALLDTYDAERRPVAWTRHEQIFARPDYADAEGWSKGVSIIDDEAMELGQLYRSTAIIGAGPELPAAQRPDEWRGQPGTRAPHFPIMTGNKPIKEAGPAASSLDLFGGRWTLITLHHDWRAIAASPATPSVQVLVADSDFTTESDVAALFGIGHAGASLIRPDGFIAWRTAEGGSLAQLQEAFAKVSAATDAEFSVAASR